MKRGILSANVQGTSRRSDADDKLGESGAGLGPLKGKIWRVGLMGETSSKTNVKAFLSALGQILNDSDGKRMPRQPIDSGIRELRE